MNTLRLWTAKSYDEFDLLTFNKSEYLDAVKPQVEAENISKILYPEDSTPQARRCVSSSSTSSCPPPSTTPSASSTRARTSRI